MRHILFSLIVLLSFTACGNQEQKTTDETQSIQGSKEDLLAELHAKESALQQARLEAKMAKEKLLVQENEKKEAFLKNAQEKQKKDKNEKLSKIGITMEEDKIIIDTNKSKDFFKNIGKSINDKLRKITTELEKGMIDEKEAGVHIDETKINIDLNKTKDFLDTWSKKMQGFVKEFDTMSKDLETQPHIKTH